jgi:hypothetical protein
VVRQHWRVAHPACPVGAAHDWKSARRSAAEWETWLAENPSRRYALLVFEGEQAGIAAYEPHPGNEVELKSFGLLPELIGEGLGGFALTLAIEQAWNLQPEVNRVWLHLLERPPPRPAQLSPTWLFDLHDATDRRAVKVL